MTAAISVEALSKRYDTGFEALKSVSLDVRKGEIFALLGPNGAGKTTLISIICVIVRPTSGRGQVEGFDIITRYRDARRLIGLVPQELVTDMFETVWATVSFSRGLFGKPPAPELIESILKRLSLWEKRDNIIMTLSGGIKWRVLIAKALAHEPQILFLDEPTAGVDVELRRDMWDVVRQMREAGVTVFLTTHYIEEPEQIADRIGIISKGEIILTENKNVLMQKLGQKKLLLDLTESIDALPTELDHYNLSISDDGRMLTYVYDAQKKRTGITTLLNDLRQNGIIYNDLRTQQSSLEEIFVDLVRQSR